MFGVGLHFNFSNLLAVRKIAIPGAVGQILLASVLGAAAILLFGWPAAPKYCIFRNSTMIPARESFCFLVRYG